MSDQSNILDKINSLIVDQPDNDKLRSLKNLIENQQNHLGLSFNEEKLDPTDGAVRIKGRVPELERVDRLVIRKGHDKTNNQLIEADNMYALSVLARIGKKYDVIYIDPPYNTGNDDLGYEDNRVADDDSFRDTKWLAFMKPRLTLARTLLKDTGVIFVSIDENEDHLLAVLMQEIFRKENHIADLIWTKNSNKNNTVFFSTNHENIFVYAKNKNDLRNSRSVPFRVPKPGYEEVQAIRRRYLQKYPDNLVMASKLLEKELVLFYKAHNELKGISQYKRVDASNGGHKLRIYRLGDIVAPGTTGQKPKYKVMHPKTGKPVREPAGNWRYSEEKMKELIAKNAIAFGSNENTVPQCKRFLDTVTDQTQNTVFINNDDGIKELMNLNISGFNNPKPLSLIRNLIRIIPNKNASVLDFFAGTGTTGQSVLSLNKEDGGHRTFTLVTSRENSAADPEKNIARDITYQRLFKVINGYKTPKGKVIEGLDANLDYFRITDASLIKKAELDSLSYDKERFGWQCSEFAIQHNAHLVQTIDETTALFSIDGQRLAILASDLLDDDLIVDSLKKEGAIGLVKEMSVYTPYPIDAHSSLTAWADENGVRLNELEIES